MKDSKFHRDAKRIPTDPAERKKRIEWLMEHRLWHYPVTIKSPPIGGEHFGPADEHGCRELLHDGPDWIEEKILSGGFYECIEPEIAYVNPETERIEDDDSKNTAFRVWIEAGGWMDQMVPYEYDVHLADGTIEKRNGKVFCPEGGWHDHNRWIRSHDYMLDCGAPDYETALLELAARVDFYYGDGHEGLSTAPSPCWALVMRNDDFNEEASSFRKLCEIGEDGYCTKCGYSK